jgi:hypothetical protein
MILSAKQKQSARPVQKDKQPVTKTNEEAKAVPDFQIPGQQYQPLLPEYDPAFGPYIQDLPSET